MDKITVKLTSEEQQAVKQLVEAGKFLNYSDCLRTALREYLKNNIKEL